MISRSIQFDSDSPSASLRRKLEEGLRRLDARMERVASLAAQCSEGGRRRKNEPRPRCRRFFWEAPSPMEVRVWDAVEACVFPVQFVVFLFMKQTVFFM